MANLHLRPQDRAAQLQLLAQHLPNASAWAYGSRINGTSHEASDLNLVLRSSDLSPIDLSDLEDFLHALKESNIPILIEARDWTRLPASFHQEILKNYVVLNTGGEKRG